VFLREHKFKMNKQHKRLGYRFDDATLTLELMALGSHENFSATLNASLENYNEAVEKPR
jgi:hypothetical protein